MAPIPSTGDTTGRLSRSAPARGRFPSRPTKWPEATGFSWTIWASWSRAATIPSLSTTIARRSGGNSAARRCTTAWPPPTSRRCRRAWNDMPLKRPLYFVHGLPGNRNAMRQNPNGEIEVSAVRPLVQRASEVPAIPSGKLWQGEWLRISLRIPARCAARRPGIAGWLPAGAADLVAGRAGLLRTDHGSDGPSRPERYRPGYTRRCC